MSIDERLSRDQSNDASSGTSVVSPQLLLGKLATFPFAFGQYEVLGLLGHGGMGAVFEARNIHLGKRVALKTIAIDRLGDPDVVKRFRAEMGAVGRLDHTNVVQAYDAGEWEGIHYLAMEYVDGVEIESLAEKCSPLPISVCCEIVRQAAYGLDHAHTHGLVHRDVKPSNLICTRDGRVVLLDLGLARWRQQLHGSLTGSDIIMGTPDYIAPEQAEGVSELDARCDIYSLGATLYRLLAGHPPFGSPDYDSVMRKLDGHRHDPPSPIRAQRKDIPDGLAALVHQMLEKQPDRRPQSAFDVAAALADWCDDSNLAFLVSDNPKRNDERSAFVTTKKYSGSTHNDDKQLRSHRLVWMSLIGILAACLVGGYFWWSAQQTTAPTFAVAATADPNNAAPDFQESRSGLKTVKPRVFEELKPNELLKSISYPLLNLEPQKIVWEEDDALARLALNQELRQLTVGSRGLGILECGTIEETDYVLQADIFQRTWDGGIGVFLGLKPSGSGERKCMGIMLKQNAAPDRKKFPLLIVPTRYTISEQGGENDLCDASTIDGEWRLPKVVGYRPRTLRLTVRTGRLKSVEWDGKLLNEFALNGSQAEPNGPELTGGFGIVSATSDATVQNMQITAGR